MAANGDEPDHLQALLGYHIWRVAGILKSSLRSRLAKLGLQGSEARILMIINNRPGISQSELGRLFEINRAALAPIVAGLVARKLVTKSAKGGRVQPLTLTRAGRSVAVRAHKCMIQSDASFFSSLSQKEAEHLREVLAQLLRRSAVLEES